MNKCIKLIVLVIAICLYGNSGFCQNYFNNLYSYEGFKEFAREIHITKNDNMLICGTINDRNSIGQVIRFIDEKGSLIWDGLESDGIHNLYSNWNHTSVIIEDSILIITSTAEKTGDFFYQHFKPYFLKYNLNQQKLEQLKFFDFSEFNISVYSAVLHTDGFIYSAGIEYLNEENLPSDILIMKFDTDGNLIWKRNIDKAKREKVCEIDSYGNNLTIAGYDSSGDTKTYISIIDTGATVLKYICSEPFASSGLINVEVVDSHIYYATMSDKELSNNETLYLAKFDEQLQTVWDTLVPNTSQYEISGRRMEIVNNQMVILSNITDALDYTNNRVWSHAAAWSLEGEFLWEHVYFQDSLATHHLDDVEALANGDLIFMGTVFNTEGQHLWLFRTDSQGCGIVQDTCYYTLDEYFGLDTMVSVVDFPFIESHQVEILGNPFSEQLKLQSNSYQLFQIIIHNIQGKMVYEGVLNGSLSLNTAHWQSGVYVMQVLDDGQLVGLEKLVRE